MATDPKAGARIERTLLAEYQLGGERFKPGTRIPLTQTQLDAAAKAGVVHADETRDADVPVNDPQGNADDESKGSPPAPDSPEARGARRNQRGTRFSKR